MRCYVVLLILVGLLLLCSCNDNNTDSLSNITPALPDIKFDWSITEPISKEVLTTKSLDNKIEEITEIKTTETLVNITEEITTEEVIVLDKKLFTESTSFWLNILGTNISYPVMWDVDKDAEYWLSHSPTGEKTKDGSLFLDTATGGIAAGITVINGHNNKNSRMFSDLVKYKTQDFADAHSVVEIIDIEMNVKKYRVFSVVLMNVNHESIQLLFRNAKVMRDYIDGLTMRSLVRTNVEINYNDIIALSTCSYEGPNYRCVVLCTSEY